jgi:isopenicillin N synthase-like dioxygenase
MTPPPADPTADLPILDLGRLEGDPAPLAASLDEAFSRIGFCYFANTGIDQGLIEAAFAASRAFHALPMQAKQAIAINAQHRGYMAPKTSVIVTSSVATVTRPNISESFMLMHEVAPDDPRFGTEVHGPNQWPAGLPGFRAAITAYDAAMRGFCLRLLPVLARALDLPADALAPHFARPTTFLRLLHYPPQPPDSPEDSFGSAPHTDYGLLTVLAQDSSGGLEVRRRDGVWLPAHPVPGTFVVNVADMLARWTNGRWQSTPHRVRNLSGGDRYSMPYFFDMDMDSVVACLPSCTGPDNPPAHPPVRYGDYLMRRLDRNYAYRQQGAA